MAGPQRADGSGDAVLLRLMLRNLLENAARYSPAGTTIEVALTATEGGTRVSVTDQGRVLMRRTASRSPNLSRRLDQRYGGSGLG